MGIAIRRTKELVKELIPYIMLGALVTSIYLNYKLINRPNVGTIAPMPYSLDVDENSDSFIRDARKKVNVRKEYRIQEF